MKHANIAWAQQKLNAQLAILFREFFTQILARKLAQLSFIIIAAHA